VTEDGIKSTHSGESEELRRGAGSFLLHGKKASVITMGEEWRHLGAEERMQAHKLIKAADGHAVEDGTISTASRRSSAVDSASVAGSSVPDGPDRKLSVVTADDFVDAKSSLELPNSTVNGKARDSLFLDAKDFRSSMDSHSIREESDEDDSDQDDHHFTTESSTVAGMNGGLSLLASNSTGAPGPAVRD
jgi:hypothetical protein